MGTTLVALLAGRGRIALAHVGDSRAYLHAPRAPAPAHRRPLAGGRDGAAAPARCPREAREHPQRHVLTRALGARRRVEADLAELTPQQWTT